MAQIYITPFEKNERSGHTIIYLHLCADMHHQAEISTNEYTPREWYLGISQECNIFWDSYKIWDKFIAIQKVGFKFPPHTPFLLSKGLLSSIDDTFQPYVHSVTIRPIKSLQPQAHSPLIEMYQFSRVLDDYDWVYSMWILKIWRLAFLFFWYFGPSLTTQKLCTNDVEPGIKWPK